MYPIFQATIEKGRLITIGQAFTNYLKRFKDGSNIELIIRKPRKDRTLAQNAYYWGVIVETIYREGEFGYESPEEVHEALKWRFLKIERDCLPTVKSTTQLSTVEFKEYIEAIQRFFSGWGINIPDPDKVMIE